MVMQNSSKSYKPRSSKFSRSEDFDESKDRTDDLPDNLSSEGDQNGIPTIVICQREVRHRGRSGRGRDEGRPPFKSGERFGSRGRPFRSRNDRDGDSAYPRNKESTSRGGSHKRSNDTDVFKNKDGVSLLPEDCRISKLLRRLNAETDLEKFFSIAKQLKEVLQLPDNERYLRRTLEFNLESMMEVIRSGPSSDARLEGAKCIGVTAIALEQDAKRLIDWVFSTYHKERNDDSRVLLLRGLEHMLELDADHRKLKDTIHSLMQQLQQTLETTESPEILYASGDAVLALNRVYPSVFAKYFRDIVDILIGWHIDVSQPDPVTKYASLALQQLHSCFIADLPFTLTLLHQFLEDMESYTEDLMHPSSGRSSPDEEEPTPSADDCLLRITSIIKVFTTVTRSLGQDLVPREDSPLKWPFLVESLEKLLVTALTIMEHPEFKEESLEPVNECACLLLGVLGTRGSMGCLYELIQKQLELSPNLSSMYIVSMLNLTSKTVQECGANLPESLIHNLLGPGSPFLQLRFEEFRKQQEAVLNVYYSLLSLKNIPLLQEAYRYVLQDLEQAYKLLVPSCVVLPNQSSDSTASSDTEQNPYRDKNPETIVLFLLQALSVLARASNSIIGMWALKPSIMELLAVLLLPSDDTLTHLSPTVQHFIIFLLYTHCSRYSNFVSSTGLVVSGRSSRLHLPGQPASLEMSNSSSPTSGHLSLILKLITNAISKPGVWFEVELLCLRWVKELMIQAKTTLPSLLVTSNFNAMLQALLKAGSTTRMQIVSSVASCFEALLSQLDNFSEHSFMRSLLCGILCLCVAHIGSPDLEVRKAYQRLLLLIPWNISLMHIPSLMANPSNCKVTMEKCRPVSFLESLRNVNKIHSSRAYTGDMGSHNFKRFMSFLLQGTLNSDPTWLQELLSMSLPVTVVGAPDEVPWLRHAVEASFHAQLVWCTWHASQFCVTFKLRTPLGKPMETFNAIEGAIKGIARELNNETSANSETPSIQELHRTRLLLAFLEHLEKNIYNAAEGCAFAMPCQAKPVRIFFNTNKAVCAEWIGRVRLATMLVALHAEVPSIVVRHGFGLLQDMLDQGNTQGTELDRAVVLIASALLALQEPEALQGLYSWCRDKASRRFIWLKPAILQASSRYEEAVVEYTKLLPVDSSDTQLEQQVKAFILDQLMECLRLLEDWTQLLKWKECQTESFPVQNVALFKSISSALSVQHVKNLGNFEQLSEFAIPHVVPNSENNQTSNMWRPCKILTSAEECFSNAIFDLSRGYCTIGRPIDKLVEEVNTSMENLNFLLEEELRSGTHNICSNTLVLQYVAKYLSDFLQTNQPGNTFSVNQEDKLNQLGSAQLFKLLKWSDKLQRAYGVQELNTELSLIGSKCARKEGNLRLAKKLLLRFWQEKSGEPITDLKTLQPVVWVRQGAGLALKETAKLLYCLDQNNDATSLLANSALECARCAGEDGASAQSQEVASRLLTSLAKKISTLPVSQSQVDYLAHTFDGLNIHGEPHAHLLMPLLQWGSTVADTRKLTEWDIQLPDVADDLSVQHLLQLSLISCPRNAKAWSHFASWCYRRGRRATEWEEEGSGPVLGLSSVEKEKVMTILGPEATSAQCEAVISTLQELRQCKSEDEDNLDIADTFRSLLPATTSDLENKLDQLVLLWGQRTQSHCYFHACAIAYFKFLQLCESQENSDESFAEATLTATLRLLRLIVKQATSLQDVLESGLALTPTTPWKGIIPQLFARLSHPESYVRRRLSELLCRLASDSPHLILFPAVVGCSLSKTTQKDDNLLSIQDTEEDEGDEEDDEEDEDTTAADDSQSSVLRSCFLSMVDILSQQAPASTAQVRLLVSELKRITVLWDELWLGCLVQHQADITRRLAQIEHEIKECEENESLSPELKSQLAREKYRIIMKPIVVMLEHLVSITTVPPETPHEKMFQSNFSEIIEEALTNLKNVPENKAIKAESRWYPFQQLQIELQQQAHRRGGASFKLTEISPLLANLRDSAIAMPGLSQSQSLVTIAGIDNILSVLPTKTRPKKLTLTGSDGRKYTYLFKGIEDLHLDERIMQFLGIANTMMARVQGSSYRARHYSVVPLGVRSGLISWVDGMQPMFSMYKRWQQREVAIQQLRNNSTAPSTTLRPSELFYNKLNPLLTERGIAVENRKDWPVAVLKQVFLALVNETPKDLLAKELWCTSQNAADWWQVTRNYSRSVAVMSVIGYIIGLGDRHLDNLLINLLTGEIAHIDYNVCFEKGLTLRVPEKVPFRMTQNLQAALGVTGLEGIFRVSCEHVLRILKRGRETLLTLLEAFVYDPLVDWTPGSEAGYTGAAYGGFSQQQRGTNTMQPRRLTRRELERETARDMLAVRVIEMRSAWLANRYELVLAQSKVSEALVCWVEAAEAVRKVQEELADAHQQIALLKEAAAAGVNGHFLFSLHIRHAVEVRARAARAQAATMLEEAHTQAVQQNDRIRDAVFAVRGTELPNWASKLSTILPQEDGGRQLFDLVHEFLLSTGHSSIVTQCNQSERDSARVITQMQLVAHTCIELLGSYRIETALFPANRLECPHTRLQAALAEELLADLSAERCRGAVVQMEAVTREANLGSREQAEQHHLQLQHATARSQARLQSAYARVSSENGAVDLAQRLDGVLAHARAQVSAFSEKASYALAAGTVRVWCELNCGILSLETAASNSGESLVDLTLREGDWFLDKLLQLSGVAAELANILLPVAPDVQPALQCVLTIHGIYKGLEDLLWNVSTIIIPEAMTALSTQQPSVLGLVSGLMDLLTLPGRPLSELCKELEVNLRFFALGLPLPHPNTQRTCATLRDGLDHLLQQYGSNQGDQSLSQGQMLLMGFNGLFGKLQNDSSKLIPMLTSVSVPPACQRLDQLYKARHLSWSVMKPGSQRITDDLFLLLRLQAMHDVFALCSQTASGFVQPDSSQNYITEEAMLQPVRRFAAEFVRHQLIGLLPQSVTLAICSVLLDVLDVNITEMVEQREVGAESRVSMTEVCQMARKGEEMGISQATSLLNQLDLAWRQREMTVAAQREVEAASTCVQRLQQRISTHAWLYDFPHCRRPVFVAELGQAVTSLANLHPSLNEVFEQQKTLVSLVTQRLKWAAGANPTLAEVVTAFNSLFTARQDQIQSLQQICSQLIATGTAVLHLETLRNTPAKAASYNSGFLQLLTQCEQNLTMVEASTANLSPLCHAEEELARIMPLTQPVDMNWILEAETLVTGKVKQLSSTMQSAQSEQDTALESLTSGGAELRSVLTQHHGLVSNVRTLLRTLTKPGDNQETLGTYLQCYRNFSEKYSLFIRSLSVEEMEISQAHALMQQLTELSKLTGPIYEELLELPKHCEKTEEKADSVSRSTSSATLVASEDMLGSPKVPPALKPPPHREKVPQEKNAYALNVWRRVRAKLEGRDLDPSKKASVAEQVEHIINEATSVDNLCLLYEGWTPWV